MRLVILALEPAVFSDLRTGCYRTFEVASTSSTMGETNWQVALRGDIDRHQREVLSPQCLHILVCLGKPRLS